METLGTIFVVTAATTLALMSLLWLYSVRMRDVSVVDAFWGPGFAVVAWIAVAIDGSFDARDLLLASMTTVWGLRLSIYLLYRNWGQHEDRRYAEMRTFHGDRFWWVSYFTVFVTQAALLWVISMPLQVAVGLEDSPPPGWLDGVGVAIWLVGLFFETIGDWQLARFKSDPANEGRVFDRGLWRYTRHPNYFGDFCVWWGLYLVAAAGGAWWTIFSPLAMSFFLLKVSGVALLERSIADRRPEYRDYQLRTNAFFPGPRKRVGR